MNSIKDLIVEPPQPDFTTAVFWAHDGNEEYRIWAVIPDDLTDGFIVGEWESVKNLHAALARLLETGQADEEVDELELDERLGHTWLSVSEAASEYSVPTDTVRYAAREGHIPMAEKQGRDWRFPRRQFLYWYSTQYTPRS